MLTRPPVAKEEEEAERGATLEAQKIENASSLISPLQLRGSCLVTIVGCMGTFEENVHAHRVAVMKVTVVLDATTAEEEEEEKKNEEEVSAMLEAIMFENAGSSIK